MTALQPKKADPTAPKELGKPLTPPTQVARVRFSPDGKVLVAACFDGTVRRWDVSGKEPAELTAISGHNGWVGGLAFAGSALFSVDSWGRLTASDVAAKEPQLWTVEAAHDGWARGVSVVPGSEVATCGKDGFVRLWNPETGKRVAEFEVKSDLLSVCFAPDGKTLFAGDLFGVVREFEVPSGKLARTIEALELYKLDRIQDVGGVKNLMVSADGKTLFVAGAEPKSGGFVQCVPLLIAFDRTGKRLSQFKGANDNEGYVTDLAWHPDGCVAGTTSGQPGQGKFFFWKPGEAAAFATGGKHPNCHSVALAPKGDVMAVSATNANSSGNGRVKGTGGDYPANTSPIQMWTVPKLG
ncbi:WD40 repeat domain-containing protein [Gemmata sp.]|uniref:WD40 repeat domain-containing protein n=1 Tax=Gemmata sp. TaxID=1914242 RepID=UPI003F721DDA